MSSVQQLFPGTPTRVRWVIRLLPSSCRLVSPVCLPDQWAVLTSMSPDLHVGQCKHQGLLIVRAGNCAWSLLLSTDGGHCASL